MEQNSEEWLKFRGNSMGASEMAVIMGISPYKKRAVLLKEKAFPFPKDGALKKDNDFVFAKGHLYEKKIRSFVEFDLDLEFPTTPTVVFKSAVINVPLHASLDGITKCLTIIIECKFVGFEAFLEYKLSGKPPEYYMIQCQQQLLITGAKKCIFAFCREVPIKDKEGKKIGVDLEYHYFDVLPNKKYHEKIIIAASEFWTEVLALRESGLPPEKNYDGLDELILIYQQNLTTLELIEVSQTVLKGKIFELVGTDKIEQNGYTVQTVTSKGATKNDFAAYFKDNKIVLPSKYISFGKGSTSQRITFKKEKEDDN